MAELAREALEGGLPMATGGTTRDVGQFAADVWTAHDLGLVLLVHRRDDGHVAEEVYYSTRDCGQCGDGRWSDAEPLGGGPLGFDLHDASARARVLRGHATAFVVETEVRLHTGRAAEDEGDEMVRVVGLLVTEEADFLEVGNLTEPASHRRPVPSGLALLAVLPGDRLHVQAVRSTPSGHAPVGEGLELSYSPDATEYDWL
ncbi:hypothetical protein QNO07_25515 [Streptomyces sp. 549]|uniref:hypothetical protein n=1 Tax=Streptomyces sp. 549 TaxID=3049076 RepID=UPI0024C41B05|nr:hypothetical protein [Streptomyces sp. 549]MDK1476719.1 hypothetical protein [Streptomyces sp. 549]